MTFVQPTIHVEPAGTYSPTPSRSNTCGPELLESRSRQYFLLFSFFFRESRDLRDEGRTINQSASHIRYHTSNHANKTFDSCFNTVVVPDAWASTAKSVGMMETNLTRVNGMAREDSDQSYRARFVRFQDTERAKNALIEVGSPYMAGARDRHLNSGR